MQVGVEVMTSFRQSVFAKSGLARGTHTLKAVKMGGTYMDSDGFKVTELITHEFALEQGGEAFELVDTATTDVLQVVLKGEAA